MVCRWCFEPDIEVKLPLEAALFSGGAPETEGETLLLKQPTDKS